MNPPSQVPRVGALYKSRTNAKVKCRLVSYNEGMEKSIALDFGGRVWRCTYDHWLKHYRPV